MSGLLFVPQPTLDGWIESGQADVTAAGLQLDDEPALALEPAWRFVSLLVGQDDASLLGRVQAEPVLRRLGASACGDSVVLGDAVYSVEPGFLARLPPDEGMGAKREGVAEAAPGPDGVQEDARLLSEFLLERLK